MKADQRYDVCHFVRAFLLPMYIIGLRDPTARYRRHLHGAPGVHDVIGDCSTVTPRLIEYSI